MPVFITQGRFTQDAIKGMLAKPEDRAEALNELLAASGAKLLGYYMTFGEYDFLVIAEGTTEQATTPLIVAAASGGVTHMKTTLALTSGEMKQAFEKAGRVGISFKSAGSQS